jgi:hypothetical protein
MWMTGEEGSGGRHGSWDEEKREVPKKRGEKAWIFILQMLPR